MERKTKIQFVGFITLAIIIKCAILYYYEVVSSDKLLQAAAAINIVDGKGYSFPVIPLDNPDTTVVRPVIEWPPLYSALLASLFKVTKLDIELSCFILDAIAGSILLLFFLLLMKKLQFPLVVQLLLLLHRAFDMNKDVLATYASDSFATAAWLAAFYFLLRYLKTGNTGILLIFSLANSCTLLFRYAYVPIAFVLPCLLLWNGIRKKTRFELYGGLISLIIAVASLGILIARNYMVSGRPLFLLEANYGLFLQNLSHWVPVFWLAFLNIDFLSTQLSFRARISYATAYTFLQLTSVLILVLLFLRYIKNLIVWRFAAPEASVSAFTYYAGAVSLSIIGLLLVPSVTTNINLPQYMDGGWSYLMEVRYFQVPSMVIFLLVSHWAFRRGKEGIFRRIAKYGVILLCILQIGHGTWVLIKYKGVERPAYSRYVASQKRVSLFLRETALREKSGGRELIVLTDKYGFLGEALIQHIKVSNPVRQLELDGFSFHNKTCLLLIIDQRGVEHYEQLLKKHQFRFETNLDGNSVFIRYY